MKLIKIYEDVFKREVMPQVDTSDLDIAIEKLKEMGVDVERTTERASNMKASQKELDRDKVKGIANDLKDVSKMKPFVLSNDGHVVDGHHRRGSLYLLKKEDEKAPVIKILLPQKQAIAAWKKVEKEL